jgi:hypothetical protein
MGEAKRRKQYQRQTGQDWARSRAALLNASAAATQSVLDHHPGSQRDVGWFGVPRGGQPVFHGRTFDPHGRPEIPDHELDEATRRCRDEMRAVYGEVVVVRNPDGSPSILANQDS